MSKIITIGSKGNEAKRKNFEGKIDNVKWEGQEMETPKTDIPLDNRESGEKIIIREYKIAFPPKKSLPKGTRIPTQDEVFNFHKKSIMAMLWKDGWEQCGDAKSVKKGSMLHILIPAKMIKGIKTNVLLETPKTLKQILTKK